MEFELNNFESFKSYFNTIAQQANFIDGFLFGDTEGGQEEAQSWTGLKLWVLPPVKSKLQDLGTDNHILGREGILWIGGPCSSEAHSDEDHYYHLCESAMKKVVSRLIQDTRESKISITVNGSMFQRADMNLSSTKFIGCEFIFTINDAEGFQFNQSDWD
jgi:hypothetical protein